MKKAEFLTYFPTAINAEYWLIILFFWDVWICISNLDRPICRSDQKRIYGVARNENAKIACEVDAFPPPTSFKWSFNNTAETIDMPQNGYEQHSKTSSRLSYTPVKVGVSHHILYFRCGHRFYILRAKIVVINGFMGDACRIFHRIFYLIIIHGGIWCAWVCVASSILKFIWFRWREIMV